MKHIKKYNEEIEEKKTLKEKIEAVIRDQYTVHAKTNNEEIIEVLKDILNDRERGFRYNMFGAT